MREYKSHLDYYIYKHTFSNGVCYIGKGRLKRAFKYSTRNTYWKRLCNKYGLPEVSFLFRGLSDKEAYEKEVDVISNYKLNGITLCNMTDGGDGLLGFSHSAETIAKIKKTKKLNPRIITDEEKIRLSNLFIKYVSENGYPRKGAKLSDEQKKRISDSHMGILVGQRNPNYNSTIYTLVHNEYGVVSGTIYDLMKKYDLISSCIYRVLCGERKSHRGFKLN